MNIISFLYRRGKQYYSLLITLMVGVILSIALIATGPLLIDTVLNNALPFALGGSDVLDGSVQITAYLSPNLEIYSKFDDAIREALDYRLNTVDYVVSAGSASPFLYPWIGGQLIQDQRINFVYTDSANQELKFLEGEWPSSIGTNGRFRGVIGEAFGLTYGLEPGDEIPLSLNSTGNLPDIFLDISGIVAPAQPDDPIWYGEFNPLRNQASKNYIVQYSALIPKDVFFEAFEALQPGAKAKSYWNIVIEPQSLKADEIDEFLIEIDLLRNELKGLDDSLSFETNLGPVLLDLRRDAASIQIPLYLLVLEIVMLSIYYLVMIAGLYNKQLEGEFSRMGSRGASSRQVLGMQTAEAGAMSIVGFLLGPIAASILILGFLYYSTHANLAELWNFNSISLKTWIAAGIGGVVSILSITLPAVPATRRSVVVYLHNKARLEKPPFWQRYYLDILILFGAIILLLRIQYTGGFISADWLLLIAPIGLLIGISTILLRLLPPMLTLFSKILDLSRGLSASLAIKHTARNPNYIARLVLLLTYTMALGMLATGLNATLNLSEKQRARYATGADIRMGFDGIVSPQFVEDRSGVSSTAGVWRSEASINVRVYRSFPEFELLAIEPFSIADVTRFRLDFSNEPMGMLLGKLVVDEQIVAPVYPLPGTPHKVGVWLSSSDQSLGYNPLEYLSLQAKIRSHQNFMILIDLELKEIQTSNDNSTTTWGYYEGELPVLSEDHYPLGVHTFWLRAKPVPEDVIRIRPFLYTLSLDDITITDDGSQSRVIESFEDAVNIWQTNDPAMTASFSRRNPTHSGKAAIVIHLPNQVHKAFSFSPANTEFSPEPLPTLVSNGFLEKTGLAIGDKGVIQLLGTTHLIEVVGSVNYFPTVYDQDDSSFMITAFIPLLNRLNNQFARPININEIWASLDGTVSADEIWTQIPSITSIQDSVTEQARIMADPLSLGLRGVTILGTFVTFILSLVGFLTFLILSTRDQETTFGVLRSLGLSKYQLYGMMLVEQLTLIIVGLGLGIFLGYLLNLLILPDLPVRLGGIDAVPPFIPQENWTGMIRLAIGLLIAYLCALVIGVFALWRMNVHQVLRIGDE